MPYHWPKDGKEITTSFSFHCSTPINIARNALGTNKSGPSPAFADIPSIPNICVVRLQFDAEASADAMQEHMVHIHASGFMAAC